MVKRKKTHKSPAPLLMTKERLKKPDVVREKGNKPVIRSYGERLLARSVISPRQFEAWGRLEHLGEKAVYVGRPRGSRLDGTGGGVERLETETYLHARRKLSEVFRVLGVMGAAVIEFMVLMGEDADTFANRAPGWNRHKILGALSLALDIAANVLGIGYRDAVNMDLSGQKLNCI